MTIYLIILFLTSLCCLLNSKQQKQFGSIILILAFLVSAFRYERIGSDTRNYLSIYGSENRFEEYLDEPIFYIICKISYEFNINPEIVQVIMSALTFIPILIYFKKYSRFFGISLLVFIVSIIRYYFETFNIVRQMISLSFMLWAYQYLIENKNKKSIIFTLIAIGFHKINLIYIPFMILSKKFTMGYKTVIITIIGTLFYCFFISSVDIFKNITLIFTQYDLLSSYNDYAEIDNSMLRSTGTIFANVIPPSILCLFTYKKLIQDNNSIIANLFFWGCIIFNLASIFPSAQRIAMGLLVLETIIYPYALTKRGLTRTYAICALIFLSIYFIRVIPSNPYMMRYRTMI